MIAQAAHELGLEGLTLKAVAEHLDVSIAALYHHVSSKDDLMRLAAEYSATRVPRPEDHGQHWAQWLYEWAVYNRDVFLAQPGLLAQYLDGAISHEAIAKQVDAILGLLVRQGFTVLEANGAYELITSCALGTAVSTIREQAAAEAGHPILATHEQLVAERGPDALPYLGQLIVEATAHGRESFHSRIVTVLYGIACRKGLDWRSIESLVDEVAAPPSSS
jgi:AcrR family transcriptional regulator